MKKEFINDVNAVMVEYREGRITQEQHDERVNKIYKNFKEGAYE